MMKEVGDVKEAAEEISELKRKLEEVLVLVEALIKWQKHRAKYM